MDILNEIEDWKIGGAAFVILAVIASVGYLSLTGGNIAMGGQNYVLEGNLIDTADDNSAITPQRLYATDTRGCDSEVIGESNVTLGKMNISFTKIEEADDSISLCLETEYPQTTLETGESIRRLEMRSNGSDLGNPLDDDYFIPENIIFRSELGDSTFEITDVNVEEPEEN